MESKVLAVTETAFLNIWNLVFFFLCVPDFLALWGVLAEITDVPIFMFLFFDEDWERLPLTVLFVCGVAEELLLAVVDEEGFFLLAEDGADEAGFLFFDEVLPWVVLFAGLFLLWGFLFPEFSENLENSDIIVLYFHSKSRKKTPFIQVLIYVYLFDTIYYTKSL